MHSNASKKKTILSMFLGKCAHCLMDNKYHYFYYYYNYRYTNQGVSSIFEIHFQNQV